MSIIGKLLMFSINKVRGEAAVAIIILIALVAGISSYFILGEPDNWVEEASESVIEGQLGLPDDSVDLTPSTPED